LERASKEGKAYDSAIRFLSLASAFVTLTISLAHELCNLMYDISLLVLILLALITAYVSNLSRHKYYNPIKRVFRSI
jgi:hypothetical protein